MENAEIMSPFHSLLSEIKMAANEAMQQREEESEVGSEWNKIALLSTVRSSAIFIIVILCCVRYPLWVTQN